MKLRNPTTINSKSTLPGQRKMQGPRFQPFHLGGFYLWTDLCLPPGGVKPWTRSLHAIKTAFSSFTRLTAGLCTVIWKPSEKWASHDSWIRHSHDMSVAHLLLCHLPSAPPSFVICHLWMTSRALPGPRCLFYGSQLHKGFSTRFTKSRDFILFDLVAFPYPLRQLPLMMSHAVNTEMAKTTQFRLIFQSPIFISDYKKNPHTAEVSSTWCPSSTNHASIRQTRL